MTETLKLRAIKVWKSWAREIVVLLLLMLPFRSSVADWNRVPTGSMKPTVLEGDRLFVNKLAYDLKVPLTTLRLAEWADPERGDVVVFFSPADGKRLVKRVVGIPGDTIALRNNRLTVNGCPAGYSPLDQEITGQIPAAERRSHRFVTESIEGDGHPIMITPQRCAFRSLGPVTVPDGKYLVLGDNRDNSLDSRSFGFVERSRIVGRASAVVVSLNRDNYYLPRPDRWLKKLP